MARLALTLLPPVLPKRIGNSIEHHVHHATGIIPVIPEIPSYLWLIPQEHTGQGWN